MPLAERRQRWAPMMDRLLTHDVHAWWRRFLHDLGKDHRPQLPRQIAAI
jgi:trehalose-6-phosphate synthase